MCVCVCVCKESAMVIYSFIMLFNTWVNHGVPQYRFSFLLVVFYGILTLVGY